MAMTPLGRTGTPEEIAGAVLWLLDGPRAFRERLADAGVRLGNPRGVLPYTVLIGADGRVVKQRIGPFAHGETDAWATP